jgi:sec-independent protein translocase protein TatC
MSEGDPDDGDDRPTGNDDEDTPPAERPGRGEEPSDAQRDDDGGMPESFVGDLESTSDDTADDERDDEVSMPEEDVTISGGAAAPEPPDGEPVAAASGAPDDQEMPLTDHIEEMVKRLGVVIVIMALVSAVIFPLGDRLINFLWYSFLPGPPTECVQAAAAAAGNFTNGTVDTVNQTVANGTAADGAGSDTAACPRLYHPLALVLARLKVASLGGFIIALPVFVYQTYLFMRPGLYPHERRYYLASVPTSLVLAGIGVAFAYFLVLPIIFQYFLGYSQPVAQVAFGLIETFGLILLMLGMFAVIFQIPLFIMLAIMMGVTTRRWLESRRLYFWFGFAGIAFLFSPDPTGMAPFIVALTMIVLFEGSLLLLRWTGR